MITVDVDGKFRMAWMTLHSSLVRRSQGSGNLNKCRTCCAEEKNLRVKGWNSLSLWEKGTNERDDYHSSWKPPCLIQEQSNAATPSGDLGGWHWLAVGSWSNVSSVPFSRVLKETQIRRIMNSDLDRHPLLRHYDQSDNLESLKGSYYSDTRWVSHWNGWS